MCTYRALKGTYEPASALLAAGRGRLTPALSIYPACSIYRVKRSVALIRTDTKRKGVSGTLLKEGILTPR